MADGQEENEQSEQSEYPEFKSNRELLLYLYIQVKQNRAWWMLPLLLVLAFLGLFVSLTGNTSILPAIYALF